MPKCGLNIKVSYVDNYLELIILNILKLFYLKIDLSDEFCDNGAQIKKKNG